VPACSPCNSRKAKDDSYVRDLFAADLASSVSPKVLSVLNGQVFRSIRKNWSHFGKLAASDTESVSLKTPSGLHLGNYPAVRVDWKRVRRFFRYVVRGLYWQAYQDRLPDDYLFDVKRVEPDAAVEQMKEFINRKAHGPFSIGEGVFGGSFGVCQEGTRNRASERTRFSAGGEGRGRRSQWPVASEAEGRELTGRKKRRIKPIWFDVSRAWVCT
jgi:hypothetical protein